MYDLYKVCLYLPKVHTFGLRSTEQGLRVLSLDHLGTIAARLRKDAVTSTKQDNDEIIDILSKVNTAFYSVNPCD